MDFGFAGVRQTGVPGPAESADLVAAVGGNTTRTTIDWRQIEPKRNDYDERRLDDYEGLYDALVNHSPSITPILVLQFAPGWARDPNSPSCPNDGCHYPPAVSELGAWQDFVTKIAVRFPKATIEIWNEPNCPSYWSGGIDASRYVQLLDRAREAVAAVHPEQRVIMGGLATNNAACVSCRRLPRSGLCRQSLAEGNDAGDQRPRLSGYKRRRLVDPRSGAQRPRCCRRREHAPFRLGARRDDKRTEQGHRPGAVRAPSKRPPAAGADWGRFGRARLLAGRSLRPAERTIPSGDSASFAPSRDWSVRASPRSSPIATCVAPPESTTSGALQTPI